MYILELPPSILSQICLWDRFADPDGADPDPDGADPDPDGADPDPDVLQPDHNGKNRSAVFLNSIGGGGLFTPYLCFDLPISKKLILFFYFELKYRYFSLLNAVSNRIFFLSKRCYHCANTGTFF